MEPRNSMAGGFELTPDLLATHGRALRGLAYSLLRDADAAEDVVQETWLACLRYPGSVPVRLSSWLGTVAGRLALRRKRGESRRRVREGRAAASERLEALQQRTLEREEALRTVTAALLALEEPFKSALLLRFFEERTPTEIAAELGLPVSTVKSRIARGLERLRTRLGAELGDETRGTRALLALVGTAGGTLVPPAPMIAGAKVAAAPSLATIGTAAAAALLLAGGATWWWTRPELEPAPLASASAHTALAAHAGVVASSQEGAMLAAGDASDSAPRREALAPPTAEGTDADTPAESFPAESSFLHRLSGTVRDGRDLPLAGARVFLGPTLFPLQRIAVTDEQGRFTLEFEARRAELDWVLGADAPGADALGLRTVRLVAGQELVLDLGLSAHGGVRRAPFLETAGVPLIAEVAGAAQSELPEKTRVENIVLQAHVLQAHVGRSLEIEDGPFERAPELARRSDGRGIFGAGPDPSMCPHSERGWSPLASLLQMRVSQRGVHELRLDAGFYLSEVAFGVPLSEAAPTTLRGSVHDSAGHALEGVGVGWGLPGRAPTDWVHTDAQGAFLLENVTPGEVELWAGGGDHGRARTHLTLAAGEERGWNAVLERGDEVTGRVLLASGDALAGLRVELWSVSPSFVWCDTTLTDDEGRFALPNVPGGALELLVWATGPVQPPSVFPVRVLAPVFGRSDVGEIVLTPRELATHALAAKLVDASGEGLVGGELRVWHETSGRGLFASAGDEPGTFRLAGLPAGVYRVEAGGPLGWRDLGRVWVDEQVELGSVRFANLGALALDLAEAGTAVPVLWSAHPDVFTRVAAGEWLGAGPFLLRPGAYVLCAADGDDTDGDGARGEAGFEVQSHATHAFALRARAQLERGPVTLAQTSDELVRASRAARCGGCQALPILGVTLTR